MNKCNSCKNNWTNRKEIDVKDLVKCTEDCRSCKRHNFALYEQQNNSDKEQDK